MTMTFYKTTKGKCQMGDGTPEEYSQVGVQNLRNININDNGLFHRLSLHMTSYITG
jgi:hypothetical protein